MHNRLESLCLQEPIPLLIYLPNFKSIQNRLLHIQEPYTRRHRTRNYTYWSHSHVFLILAMTVEKPPHYNFGAWTELKTGDAKISLASSISFQMTKFSSSWKLSLRCTWLIILQPKKSTVIVTSKFSFTTQSHSTIYVWQLTTSKISRIFAEYTSVVEIMQIYAKILLSNKMPNKMILSCHIHVLEWIYTLYLLNCQGNPCLKQLQYLKYNWVQHDSNSQPFSL